jgi:hypothetical protein
LAGIHAEGAGSASGVLSSTQQVGGAIGIALIGVIFFGLVGVNAPSVVNSQAPQLTRELTTLGVPPRAVDGIVTGFRTCFNDRAHAKDPTADPVSCQRGHEALAALPLPAGVKDQVQRTVSTKAAPRALGRTFSRSFQQTLLYEIAIYLLAFALVFTLPKVNPHSMGPTPIP